MRMTWSQVKTIVSFLFFRSSIAFALSGLVLLFFPVSDMATALLIVVFPQSACTFWPYAHMTAVGQMESKLPEQSKIKTFDQGFAMNVLACSMPFSVILIMAIYTSGDFFANITPLFASSGIFLVIAACIVFLSSNALADYRSNLKVAEKIDSPENPVSLQES